MPKLKKLLVIHTTSNEDLNANSAADFSLEISRLGQDVTLPFPKNPGQRQKGSSTRTNSTCRSIMGTWIPPAST